MHYNDFGEKGSLDMDMMEKINRSFATWYEGLFGGGTDDVRPKDVLRRILSALEDHRKEGFDNRVYVPNQYILEINVQDEEEKAYLLSFLNRDELETAIRRHCKQNNYVIRGRLDFTIREADPEEAEAPDARKRTEKVRVRCRYNNAQVETPALSAPAEPPAPVSAAAFAFPPFSPNKNLGVSEKDSDERTVAAVPSRAAGMDGEEEGTVSAVIYASLMVYAPDRTPFRYAVTRDVVNLGRSRNGNEIVLESDGQASKRHARLEMQAEGRFTLTDLASTNGTRVNGKRIEARSLNDGDEIILGSTRIEFRQENGGGSGKSASASLAPAPLGGEFGGAASPLSETGSSSPASRVLRSRAARLVLLNDEDDSPLDDFLLASETRLGRGITNDVVLPDRSLAIHHAQITFDGESYLLEALPEAPTALNETPLASEQPARLQHGDRVRLGSLTLRFENGV